MKIKRIVFFLILISISISCSLPTITPATPTIIIITEITIQSSDTSIPTNTNPPLPTATDTLIPDITHTPSPTPTLGQAMLTPNTTTNVNCRFGPSMDYVTVGALVVGESVPIQGTSADHLWWQIKNSWIPGGLCWVSAAVTTASGDLSKVPIIAAPAAQVIEVSITAPDTIHGHCGGPTPTSFEVSITTNGPATVTYHLSIYNGDGSLRNETSDETRSFAAAGTQTFDPGGAYKTDCGDFYAKVVVTSPNAMSDRVDWSVVEP